MMRRFCGLSLAILLVNPAVSAQEYVPIAENAQNEKAAESLVQLGVPSYREAFLKAQANLLSPGAQPFDPLKCLTPPKIADLTTQISNRTMSASRAASLGFGVFSTSVNSNATVFIQDWTRSARCLSQDGKTQLIWGQAVRIVASISDVDANANLSLASIADVTPSFPPAGIRAGRLCCASARLKQWAA
jgi:hypothetical protein